MYILPDNVELVVNQWMIQKDIWIIDSSLESIINNIKHYQKARVEFCDFDFSNIDNQKHLEKISQSINNQFDRPNIVFSLNEPSDENDSDDNTSFFNLRFSPYIIGMEEYKTMFSRWTSKLHMKRQNLRITFNSINEY